MKKQITIVLEVEADDDWCMTDKFIKSDLEQEIHCASNWYDFVSFKTEEIKE